jgi:poly-gamma-glutamate synthesis protein (capsule biosynthesis protein)
VEDESVLLCLAGDVMTGRGVDQILPFPSRPALRERYVDDARTYVDLAERANGPIPRPVDFAWPWGAALGVIDDLEPDLRLINLETSVTRSDRYDAGKGINYRMHPRNIGCIAAMRPAACAVANNHVLDFGVDGLRETLSCVAQAGLAAVGAGHDSMQAWRPLVLPSRGRRVLIWAVAEASSGVPRAWAARPDRPGVAYLPDLSEASLGTLVEALRIHKRPGDVAVVSIHWGSNWGYEVSPSQIRFAHRLIDSGVDVIHGHSSHHPRPIEIYHHRLVLYGCGDLINDYEGIAGHEAYRSDVRLLYFARLALDTQELQDLRMLPLRCRRMRLEPAPTADAGWLGGVLDRISRGHGSRVAQDEDGALILTES